MQHLIQELEAEARVDLLPLPGLVDLAEKFSFAENEVFPYLQEVLAPYTLTEYAAIVLGCTHFIFFKDSFRKLLPENMAIIDGNQGTINHLENLLAEKQVLGGGSGKIIYYNSAVRQQDAGMLEKYQALFDRLDDIG